LASLTPSEGALTPTFASGTTNYSTAVGNEITTFMITPTVVDLSANIKVNGVAVNNGAASGSIALTVGKNTITTEVTAQDGTTKKVYTIVVTRAASANANLSAMGTTNGNWAPVFSPNTTNYSTNVAYAVTSMIFTPTATDKTATIKVNGLAVNSGASTTAIALNVGTNMITTVVTAQDGVTVKTYTFTVVRANPQVNASSNANLASLVPSSGALSPLFVTTTVNYTLSVINSISSITLIPTVEDIKASVKINGSVVSSGAVSNAITLNVGANVVTIQVTAEDGTTVRTYTINVTREIGFVNQPPTLNPIADRSVCANVLPQVINLTGISPGPELSQTLSLTVTSSNADLFSQLSITNSGIITYVIKQGGSGNTTLTVKVKDDGGVANGGVDEITRSFVLTVNPLPTLTITSDKGSSLSKGDQMFLTATGGVSYSWANANGIIAGQNTATLAVRPSQNTTYTVTATNASGCTSTQSFSVTVLEDFTMLSAVNILSPNGDGVNDFWIVNNIELYPKNEVKIVDRAGRAVFSMKGYDNKWNGMVRGIPLAVGTYYYIVDFGNEKTLKGFITILK
ncbi:MAG: cadherin-like beta sandwich domain-containing protein, partial [Bacteroidia bacterium]